MMFSDYINTPSQDNTRYLSILNCQVYMYAYVNKINIRFVGLSQQFTNIYTLRYISETRVLDQAYILLLKTDIFLSFFKRHIFTHLNKTICLLHVFSDFHKITKNEHFLPLYM